MIFFYEHAVSLSKAGRAKVEKVLDEARALMKEMGKTAASSGRPMKKAKVAPKANR